MEPTGDHGLGPYAVTIDVGDFYDVSVLAGNIIFIVQKNGAGGQSMVCIPREALPTFIEAMGGASMNHERYILEYCDHRIEADADQAIIARAVSAANEAMG